MRFPEKSTFDLILLFFIRKFLLPPVDGSRLDHECHRGGGAAQLATPDTIRALPQSAVLGECNANVFHGSCGMITAQPGG
jgi:hypothetical protein